MRNSPGGGNDSDNKEEIEVYEMKKEIILLQEEMKKEGIDYYLIPTDDFHGSEYVGDYFKCREFMSGFTGSAGNLLVSADRADLWTDGRYFLQATDQLDGTDICLRRMGDPGVPTLWEYLYEQLKNGGVLGFDGRTVGAKEIDRLRDKCPMAEIKADRDLVDRVWTNRPAMSAEPVFELEIAYSGKSRADKLSDVREAMKQKDANVLLLPTLDDIAWLLNLRGNDVQCNPVFLSFLAVTMDEVVLFANIAAFGEEVQKALSADGVVIAPYNDIYAYTAAIPEGQAAWVNMSRTNYAIADNLCDGVKIIDEASPTLLMKAIKNQVEMENIRASHVRDGVAMCRFLYWLKTNAGKMPMTELSVSDKIEEFRKMGDKYMGPSFDYIVGYADHGAIIHYEPTKETDVPVQAKGLLLLDTGGQYLDGTTDITRTVVMGPVTEEEKHIFTLVLRGHLRLMAATFKKGCIGMNFDILARGPLWDEGIDYNHGTGHGVGFFLNVHEAPNGFRYKIVPERNETALFATGMLTSNEPGCYLEGKFGVRHENLMLTVPHVSNAYGEFMKFETVTLVPFDLDGLEIDSIPEDERKILNEYHKKVYDTIAPLMANDDERAWLQEATRAI